jgi:inner membrane transporter RhtA
VCVLGAIASVQIGSAVAKGLFDRAGPTGTVFLRLAFAAAIVVGVARPQAHAFDPRGRPRGEVTALAGYALTLAGMNWSFYEAIDRIPLGVAVTFEFLGPLGVALAGSFSPRAAASGRLREMAWALLAGTGVALLGAGTGAASGGSGPGTDGVGIAFAVLAGAFWACYILLSARIGRTEPGLGPLAVALALGAALLAPAGIVAAGTDLLTPTVLLGGLAVALLSSAVPYSLELTALRRMSPSVFGVMMSLEPAAAALAGLVILGESLGTREIVAITLVSIASAGAALHRSS